MITCCVHGTKTHERNGIKCIDIWDIFRDESLTADFPALPDKSPDISGVKTRINDIRNEIKALTRKFNSIADELVMTNEKLKQLEAEIVELK